MEAESGSTDRHVLRAAQLAEAAAVMTGGFLQLAALGMAGWASACRDEEFASVGDVMGIRVDMLVN